MQRNPTTASGAHTAAPPWEELQRRLEAAQAALERGFAPHPEAQRQRLRERARALAHVPAPRVLPQQAL
jgi:hypothetical protein